MFRIAFPPFTPLALIGLGGLTILMSLACRAQTGADRAGGERGGDLLERIEFDSIG